MGNGIQSASFKGSHTPTPFPKRFGSIRAYPVNADTHYM